MGRILIIMGIIFIVAGIVFVYFPDIPIGRLPGDIHIKRDNTHIYIPIMTGLIISIALSAIFWIITRFMK